MSTTMNNGTIAGVVLLNLVVSVGVIVSNKYLFTYFGWSDVNALTFMHFLTLSVGVYASMRLGLFEHRAVALREVAPLAAAFCGWVVLNNLSLQLNLVSIYQTLKLLTTPITVVIEFVGYDKRFPAPVLLSLAVTVGGAIVATLREVRFNPTGTIVALAGVTVTAFYQIWIADRQKRLHLNTLQLLLYQAPLACGMLLPLFPLYSDAQQLRSFDYSGPFLMVLAFSCASAFGLNITSFTIIGQTSPVTACVLGIFKHCATLLLGTMIFGEQLPAVALLGIVVSVLGVVWYSYLKLPPQAIATTSTSASLPLPAATEHADAQIGASNSGNATTSSTSSDDAEQGKGR